LRVASAEDIAWAAGLFEGEGTISQIERRRNSLDLQVAINMTDEDVLKFFDDIVGRGKVYGPYLPLSHGDRRKPFFRWVALGDAGHDVLDLIGPWLFPRRVEQARLHGVLIPPHARPRRRPDGED
jgi:hypothetical protein